MQQRRFRPGDVLDDYCPRERRITDHAIVAMIDDRIKQTRCVVCDAEHEYKDGKAPVQRRKKGQAALFTQVLDGLQGPQPAARLNAQSDAEPLDLPDEPAAPPPNLPPAAAASLHADAPVAADDASPAPPREDRPWRRQLIRAALPRPEGQQPQPTRQMPEFTVRQPTTRGPRHPRRQGGGQPSNGNSHGPMRFGREAQGGGGGQRPAGGRRRRGGKKR